MMWNRIKDKFYIYCLVAFAALVVAVSATCRRSPNSRQSEPWESRIFSKYVLDPIPKSVADIKVDELEYPGLGHCYVMRFRIEKGDLTLVLNSQMFQEFTSVVYEQGNLFWREINYQERDPLKNPLGGDTSSNLPLYTNQRQQQPPEWFRPNDWDIPKVYVVEEKYGKSRRYQTKVLIYNEKLEEAYFIEYLQGH